MTRQEFVRQAYAAASQSSASSGMPALVTVAQAALESSWGQSKLSREANNYFGIKAHGSQVQVQMNTEEYQRGTTVTIDADFAKYSSMLDCFQCRDRILLRNPIYAGARQMRGDEDGFIAAMAKHWATDPKYADKLQAVLREVKGLVQ